MSGMPRPEWKGRADFAEYAEAVGCETDEVVTVLGGPDAVMILYSPGVGGVDPDEIDPATPMLRTALRRDGDRVLRVVKTEPAGTLGEFMEKIEKAMLGD
jgi:hypothetical protein